MALLGGVRLEAAFAATGDLMGAQEVIQRLGRVAAVPGEAKPDAGTAAAETLARDLREFKTVRDRKRRVIPDPGEAVAGDQFIRGVVQFVTMSAISSDRSMNTKNIEEIDRAYGITYRSHRIT